MPGKNASFLRVVRCRSLAAELERVDVPTVGLHLEDGEHADDVVYYTVLRAIDRFHADLNRYPGTDDSCFESDIPHLKVGGGHLVEV